MIHVENLVKTFGEVKAVDGVSFDVAKPARSSRFSARTAPGKTTTIQMLTTLLRPTERIDAARRPRSGDEPARGPAHASASCFRIRASTAS